MERIIEEFAQLKTVLELDGNNTNLFNHYYEEASENLIIFDTERTNVQSDWNKNNDNFDNVKNQIMFNISNLKLFEIELEYLSICASMKLNELIIDHLRNIQSGKFDYEYVQEKFSICYEKYFQLIKNEIEYENIFFSENKEKVEKLHEMYSMLDEMKHDIYEMTNSKQIIKVN